MDDYIISDDIYKECLSQKKLSYQISEDVSVEAQSLNKEVIKTEICNTYLTSSRFWILRLGTHKNLWRNWVKDGEIRLKAPGFYYLRSYGSLSEMSEEYEKISSEQQESMAKPIDYYSFAYRMQKGDIVMARSQNEIIGWGIIESQYLYDSKRANGRHYRKVTWNEIKMPFFVSHYTPFMLYKLPKEETNILKEALIERMLNDIQSIPLPFETKKDESSSNDGLGNKQTLCLLSGIISSLLLAKR